MRRERIMPADHPWYWSMEVPFSQGWRVGNMVFVGSQISADRQEALGRPSRLSFRLFERGPRTSYQSAEHVLRGGNVLMIRRQCL